MNVHLADERDVREDEYGRFVLVVKCGTVGSYYTTDRSEVTCELCRLMPEEREVSGWNC